MLQRSASFDFSLIKRTLKSEIILKIMASMLLFFSEWRPFTIQLKILIRQTFLIGNFCSDFYGCSNGAKFSCFYYMCLVLNYSYSVSSYLYSVISYVYSVSSYLCSARSYIYSVLSYLYSVISYKYSLSSYLYSVTSYIYIFSILYIYIYSISSHFIQSSCLYSISHTLREDIVPHILPCSRFRNNQIELRKCQIQKCRK